FISMFIPGAGFITAIISIYDIVMVFVEKIRKIIQVVTAFVDSIVAIAAGRIDAAAKRVESVLAGFLSLAISFLAGFAGLGKVADKVMGVINRVRAMIDKGLDKLIEWIVTSAKKLFMKVFGKDDKQKKPADMLPGQKLAAAVDAGEKLLDEPNASLEGVRAKLPAIQATYGIKVLRLVVDSENDEESQAHVHGEINPGEDGPKKKIPKNAKTTEIGVVDIPRESMKWFKKTKVALAKKFVAAGGPATAVSVVTGTILTKKKYGRRHIISFSDMVTHYKTAFHPKLMVDKAVGILLKFQIDTKYTKPSVHSKVRTLVRRAFNEPTNVAIGLQAANSSLGAVVDTAMLERHGQTVQKALDDHIKKFLTTWGVPGVSFGVTVKRDDAPIEWEVTEV